MVSHVVFHRTHQAYHYVLLRVLFGVLIAGVGSFLEHSECSLGGKDSFGSLRGLSESCCILGCIGGVAVVSIRSILCDSAKGTTYSEMLSLVNRAAIFESRHAADQIGFL